MNWLAIDKVSIFSGKDENGNRYLSQFLQDYKQVFDRDEINAGCPKCLENYYQKFTKHLSRMGQKETSNYRLKAKYNGISLGFGSNVIISNRNITDELGAQLLEKHPAGKQLFEKYPQAQPKPLDGLKREELNEIATDLGIDPADYSKKSELAAAIEDVRKA